MNITPENVDSLGLPWLSYNDSFVTERSAGITHTRTDSFKGWHISLYDSTIEIENTVHYYFDEPGQPGVAFNGAIALHQDEKIAKAIRLWMEGATAEDCSDIVTGWTSSYSG